MPRCFNLSAILLTPVLLIACKSSPTPSSHDPAPTPSSSMATKAPAGSGSARAAAAPPLDGKVTESIDVANYTYLNLETSSGSVWAAVPKTTIAVGDQASIERAMPMKNFHSPTLKRTFPKIYFGVLKGTPGKKGHGMGAKAGSPHGAEAPLPIPSEIKVPKAKGPNARSVAEVHKQGAKLGGKAVVVQGLVVKVNNGILERNWIHVRDGSGSDKEKNNDLIITSQETARIGEVVVVKGKVATKRDFGSGYAYDVLIEDASFTVVPGKK